MDMFQQQVLFAIFLGTIETEQTHWWMLPHSFCLNYYSLAVAVHLYIYPLPETVNEKLCLGQLRNLERWSSYAGMDQSNAPVMLSSVTGSLWLRACRTRCFIDITMALSVGRSWRAANISALNNKTRLIGLVGYLEPLSTYIAILKIFKNSTRFAIVFHSSSLHILSSYRRRARHRSTSCWLINSISIMGNKHSHKSWFEGFRKQ